MQDIQPGEAPAAIADLLHCRLVEIAPAVRESSWVSLDAVAREESGGLPGDAAAPIHHGAKGIEKQRLDRPTPLSRCFVRHLPLHGALPQEQHRKSRYEVRGDRSQSEFL